MPQIRIQVRSEDDLFDRFDAERETLSDDFTAYLKKKYSDRWDGDITTFLLVSDAPLDEARIRVALNDYILHELEKNRKQRRRNRFIELYLFLIGLACIAAGILLSKAGTMYLQILSLTAGFAIKEAATIFFMKNPRNTLERAKLSFMMRSRMEFQHTGTAPSLTDGEVRRLDGQV